MCTSPAPQTAIIEDKNEDEIKREKDEVEKKHRLEEEIKQKEQELRVLKEQEEQRKKQEEELAIKKLQDLNERTINQQKNTEVVEYLFAQYNHGKDAKPFLVMGIMHNGTEKQTQVNFVRIGYHQHYLKQFIGSSNYHSCNICNIPFVTTHEALDHVFAFHKTLIESEYPIFIGGQLIHHKWNIKTNRHECHTMKCDEQGQLIWPFEKLDAVFQVGTDITPEQSIFIVGVGRKQGDTQ